MPQTPPNEQRYSGTGNDLLQQIHVAVIRVDGKSDNLNQRFTDFRDAVAGELKAIRDIQKDQEDRLRKLQDRDYVAPSTVWKVVGALISIMGIVTTIVIAVMNK